MTTLSAGSLLRFTAAGAVGALSLVEPRRLGPWAHGAYRVGVAALSGAIVAESSRHDLPLLDPVRDGVVTGGVTLGLMDVLERIDGVVVDGLHHAGLSRPRLLLAALGAAGTAVMFALPSLSEQSERWGSLEEVFDEPETTALPREVRDLIAVLLAPSTPDGDLPGAAALREQLEVARAVDPGYPSSDVQIAVEDPAGLAVPRQQVWPVSAGFVRAGIRYALQLQIEDGRLGMLSVMVPEDEPRLEQALERLSSPGFVLPDPQEITLRRETGTP